MRFLGYTYSRYQVACPMSAIQKMIIYFNVTQCTVICFMYMGQSEIDCIATLLNMVFEQISNSACIQEGSL